MNIFLKLSSYPLNYLYTPRKNTNQWYEGVLNTMEKSALGEYLESFSSWIMPIEGAAEDFTVETTLARDAST